MEPSEQRARLLVGGPRVGKFPGVLLQLFLDVADFLRPSLELAVAVPHHLAEPPHGHREILAVALAESFHRIAHFPVILRLLAIRIERLEGFCDLRDEVFGDGRKSLAERVRKHVFLHVAHELRLAELDEKVDQRAVALASQLEQRVIHRIPVFGGFFVNIAPPQCLEMRAELGFSERNAVLDEVEIFANSIRGNKEPTVRRAAAFPRFHAAGDGDEMLATILVPPPEF